MAFITKLLIFFALSLGALAAQIPIRDKKLHSGMVSYSPPDKEVVCTVFSALDDHHGRATWFEPGLGNCGWTNTRNDKVLAISKTLYDRNGGSNCGQWVEIVDDSNGKKTWGQTVDSCPGCGDDDLDLSPALFQDLDSLDVGVLSITWHFLPTFNGN